MKKNISNVKAKTVLSLYTGAGGFDLGLEAANYKIVGCVEIDNDARETILRNRPNWNLLSKGDIFKYKPNELLRESKLTPRSLDLLVGGPPCQPFSKAAHWTKNKNRRLNDPRSKTLTAYFDVLEAALPKAFILENVEGFALLNDNSSINLISKKIKKINKLNSTNYKLSVVKINSADYGVPQMRERLFIVGSRDGKTFNLPPATHSQHGSDKTKKWLTAWDAIGKIKTNENDSDLKLQGKWADLLPSIPEGQNYLWHTPKGGGKPLFGWRTRYWNFLLKLAKSKPSWTIPASPGPATGPFHWNNRLLSIAEMAAIQTFPKDYKFFGTYKSVRKQIGNAVPCAIGEFLGNEINKQYFKIDERRILKFIPRKNASKPPRVTLRQVSRKFFHLIGNHKEHAGVGKGPGAQR